MKVTRPTPKRFAKKASTPKAFASRHRITNLKSANQIRAPLLDERQQETKRRRSYELYVERLPRILPDPFASGFLLRETRRQHEEPNLSGRLRLAFRLPSVGQRAFSAGVRHGLLAWRRFWQACILEWRTVARNALRC